MQNPIVAILIILFVWGPIVTFIHELGHAFNALLITRQPVYVQLGKMPRRYRFGIGQLRFEMGPTWNPILLSTGICTWQSARLGHWGHIFILLGGPLASWHQLLLYGSMAYYWGDSFGGWMMQLASWMALSSLTLTIIPMRYPKWWGYYGGTRSDGLAIVHRLRALRAQHH